MTVRGKIVPPDDVTWLSGRYESKAVRDLVRRADLDMLQHPLSPYAPMWCERCGGVYEQSPDFGPWDECCCRP